MQYNGFEIQITEYGCIVRDKAGKYLVQTPTEQEAIEWIDDYKEVQPQIDWYKRFELYCKKMPCKCYIDDMLASSNSKILYKFIDNFEKQNNVEVYTRNIRRGLETFVAVEEIKKS